MERRKLQGIDRHWTPEQFTAFTSACREEGREDYAAIATLTFYVGLRIHEACRLDTAAVEAWERSGLLTVKGKGGRVRSVPVTAAAAKQALRERKAAVRRGHKLFVPDDVATDAYIYDFQAAQLCSPAVSGSVGWRGYRVPGKVGGVQAAGPRPRRCDGRIPGIRKARKSMIEVHAKVHTDFAG